MKIRIFKMHLIEALQMVGPPATVVYRDKDGKERRVAKIKVARDKIILCEDLNG